MNWVTAQAQVILNGTGIDIYSFEQIMVVIPDEASWGGVSFDCLVCRIFHKYASHLTHYTPLLYRPQRGLIYLDSSRHLEMIMLIEWVSR